MRAMLLIFLGVCLGGCVAESQRTDDVSAPEVEGETESDPSFSSSPFVGDKRTVVGTTGKRSRRTSAPSTSARPRSRGRPLPTPEPRGRQEPRRPQVSR